ncbi:hypothetical protein [Streptomyces sp. NPDC052127]|uniref:hypothetical protein n=1 Tax=Streptomyces sp. NPDC052127 TaxID=3155679 RepID=UPI003427D56C
MLGLVLRQRQVVAIDGCENRTLFNCCLRSRRRVINGGAYPRGAIPLGRVGAHANWVLLRLVGVGEWLNGIGCFHVGRWFRLVKLALPEGRDEACQVFTRDALAASAGDLVPPEDVRGEGGGIGIGAMFLRVREPGVVEVVTPAIVQTVQVVSRIRPGVD